MKRKIVSLLVIMSMVLTLMPVSAFATQWTDESTIRNDWYYLRSMNNYLNITADGKAELRKLSENEAFYVESKGGSQFTLKMKDGRYLGLEDSRKDGTRVKAVKDPYIWLIHWEATNFNKDKSDIFSLRPPEAPQLVVNASGQKNADGTNVILWTYKGLDAPNHAEFRFIKASSEPDTSGESWSVYTENNLYGYKDAKGNVVIKAQFDRAEKFSQGIAKVYDKYKGACAYINTSGKLITPFKYYPAASSHIVYDGLVKVAIEGEEVVKAIMNGDGVVGAGSENGVTMVMMRSGKQIKPDDKYGFIDTTGKEVIPLKFDEAMSFQDGMAAVYQYQGRADGYTYNKIGYIDKTGKQVIPYKYGGENMYNNLMLCYKDGLTCFVEYLGAKGFSKGLVLYAPVGVMDKAGKAIIPGNKDRIYPSSDVGFQWADGIITNTYTTEVNKSGVPTKGGGYSWTFAEIYDYSGKLIKKLDGYRVAVPLGGGYTLAKHQLNQGQIITYLDTQAYECYWTVFDRYGNIVVDFAAKNDYYVLGGRADGYGYGYANGYVYFAGESYKVADMPAPVKPAPAQPEPAKPAGPSGSGDTTAKPTATKFMLNDKEVNLPAYNINSNNFVKLRDVAALLKTRFDVRWEDGKAKLYNHALYTRVGGELAEIGKDSKSATLSTTDFVWAATAAPVTGLTAYTIGGNNYIKLRDIAKLFDFDVDWRDGKAWIEPDVSPYTED
ncbi:MAG TPA: WG repeat-containing protein [Clostridiales bacterium]|nr:WG repeat-containing protein [Clostridiales bacterium]